MSNFNHTDRLSTDTDTSAFKDFCSRHPITTKIAAGVVATAAVAWASCEFYDRHNISEDEFQPDKTITSLELGQCATMRSMMVNGEGATWFWDGIKPGEIEIKTPNGVHVVEDGTYRNDLGGEMKREWYNIKASDVVLGMAENNLNGEQMDNISWTVAERDGIITVASDCVKTNKVEEDATTKESK